MSYYRYIPRMINLEPRDYYIARRLAEEKGYGKKGLSQAIRFIIRDWDAMNKAAAPQPPGPSPRSQPDR